MKALFVFLISILLTGCLEPTPEDIDMTRRSDVESVSGGWSSTGVIVSGSTDEKVSLQAVFPTADTYTVQFQVADDPLLFANPVALITWTIEGNYVTRKISVTNGASISGAAQGVRVVVFDESLNPANPGPYPVSITVTPGTRPAEEQPPTYSPLLVSPGDHITRPGAIIVPPGGLTIPIDTSIGVISIFATVGSTVPAVLTEGQVQIRQERGPLLLKSYDPRMYDWVPISPAITDLTLANATLFDLVYSITFGIDG